MNCEKCKITCDEIMLHRTKPYGQYDGGWMCLSCIENHEPELARNIKVDEGYQALKDIEAICLGR